MNSPEHIVLVGASAAGITAARTLRAQGWKGKLTLVGKERGLPYDRPPLSKRLMAGACEVEALNLMSRDGMNALDMCYVPGTSATSICSRDNAVHLDDGTTLHYDRLLVATGADARVIPSLNQAANCYRLRSVDDALAIRRHLTAGRRLLIVGAGFIGTELAAIARAKGTLVTIIDKGQTPLAARVGAIVGRKIEELHEANRVTFHNDREIMDSRWNGNSITEVCLDNGTWIPCDLVVVAIGAVPNVQWCRDSGVAVRAGLVCNEFCEAGQNIFVAGDAAEWFHRGYGEHMRLEHRTNASEQAMTAAKNMLGARVEYVPLPFFWSDQYHVQLHSYGRIGPQYTVDVLYGEAKDNSFIFGYFQGDALTGVLSWNASRKAREYVEPLKSAWTRSSAHIAAATAI